MNSSFPFDQDRLFQTIDYTSPRGGVTVLTSPPTRGHGGQPTSRSASTLLVSSVRPTDSGKYACRPSNAEAASVTVHILDGESTAQYIQFEIETARQKSLNIRYKAQSFLSYIARSFWIMNY